MTQNYKKLNIENVLLFLLFGSVFLFLVSLACVFTIESMEIFFAIDFTTVSKYMELGISGMYLSIWIGVPSFASIMVRGSS